MDSPRSQRLRRTSRQTKNIQPLGKGQRITTGTTHGELSEHIGRYSTIHAKYVNEHFLFAKQFVSQLDHQSEIRVGRE